MGRLRGCMENLNTTASEHEWGIAQTLLDKSTTAVLALPSGGCARHVTSRTVSLQQAILKAPRFSVALQDPHQIKLFETGAMTLRLEDPSIPGYTLVLYGKLHPIDDTLPERSYRMNTTSIRLLADAGNEWTLPLSHLES